MCHAYWYIPPHKESQEFLSIQTPLGVNNPVRLLQGQTDAGNKFQSVPSRIFRKVVDRIIQWLEDVLMHEHDEKELLHSILKFIRQCGKYKLKQHANKCKLFQKEYHLSCTVGAVFNPRAELKRSGRV